MARETAATIRRIVALTCGLSPADVPDAVVTALAESDQVPVCWHCVESLLGSGRTTTAGAPTAPHTTRSS